MPENQPSPSQGPRRPDDKALSKEDLLNYRAEWLGAAHRILSLAQDKTLPILAEPPNNNEVLGKTIYIDLPDMIVEIDVFSENPISEQKGTSSNQAALNIFLAKKYAKTADGVMEAEVINDERIIEVTKIRNGRVIKETDSSGIVEVTTILSEILNHPDTQSIILDPESGSIEFNELLLDPDN